MVITELKVKGDSDQVYTVAAQQDGTVTCTCPAFRFRKDRNLFCKHQRFVVGVLLGQGADLVAS